jgi:hypothetical protein
LIVDPYPPNAALLRIFMRYHALFAASALALCTSGGAQEPDAVPEAAYRPCNGMPLSQVREVDFMAFYPPEKQAVRAAAEIDKLTFLVTVRTSASTPEWVVRAVYRELPDPDAHDRHAGVMERIARRHGSKDHGAGCGSQYYPG